MVYIHTYNTKDEQDAVRNMNDGSAYIEPWLSIVKGETPELDKPYYNIEPAIVLVMGDGSTVYVYPKEIEDLYIAAKGTSSSTKVNVKVIINHIDTKFKEGQSRGNVVKVILTRFFPTKVPWKTRTIDVNFDPDGITNEQFFPNISEVYYDANVGVSKMFQELGDNHPLQTLTFGPNCTEPKGWNTFTGCRNLSVVYIPDTMVQIKGGSYFENIDSWEHVEINGTTYYGQSLFVGCQGLKSVKFQGTLMFGEDDSQYPCCKYLFMGCINLTNIDLPNDITAVPYGLLAGTGVKSIEDINMPTTVTTLRANAFMQSKIENINLPSHVTTIGSSCFQHCFEVKSVKLGGVEEIRQAAFAFLPQCVDFDLPETLTTIRSNAFYRTIPADYSEPSYPIRGIDTTKEPYTAKYKTKTEEGERRVFFFRSDKLPKLMTESQRPAEIFQPRDKFYFTDTAYADIFATEHSDTDYFENAIAKWKTLYDSGSFNFAHPIPNENNN